MSENDYFMYTVVLIVLFASIVFWAFNKKRKKRFDKDKDIPFQERQ